MTTETFPFISILIPIRNESLFIKRVLFTLLTQDFPDDHMEILVINGMSTDNTCAIIQEFAIQNPELQIRILDNLETIVSTAMNLALQQAKGEIIIRIDGHTVIAPDYIRQCAEALYRTGADNVGGRMKAIGTTLFGKAVAIATTTSFGIGGGRFHISNNEEWVDTVYMGAWPRRVFEKIGLFDEELVRDQDDEFNYRLREQGGKILLSPNIRSEYFVRSTPRALWLQYYQYGLWKVRVLQKHPRQMSLRQFVPPIFVLALLASIIPAFSPLFYTLSTIVPLLYLLVNLCASFWTASRRDWSALIYLPFVFAILHIGYGSGFLIGLLKFANRWTDKVGKTPSLVSEDA